jgi:thioesterase domain-containing protein
MLALTRTAPVPTQIADPALAAMRQLAAQAAFKEALGKANTVIVPLNQAGDAPPFYCVHSLSGKANDYIQLAALLGPRQPFFGIQIPTRNRDPEFGGALESISVETIAHFYVDSIEQFQPAGPLALGGWSFGAILALEMAQELKARGRDVVMLVAFDIAPTTLLTAVTGEGAFYKLEKLIRLPGWLLRHDLVRRPSLKAWGAVLRKKLSAGGADKGAVPAFFVNEFIDVSKYPPAHAALMQKMLDAEIGYRPKAYDGAVRVFAASRQVSQRHFLDLKRAWAMIAPRATISAVQGTHRSMLESRDGVRLAALLRRCLMGK